MKRVSSTDAFNKGLKSSVVEVNNHWRKRERGRLRGKGMSMIVTYTQVENTLGIHLCYLNVLRELPMLPIMQIN